MTRRQHLDERHDPKLQFTGSSSAVSYHFRSSHGWAICTVNDTTGELSIQSDWGSWQHRWSSDPKHLGAPTLTAFLRDRKAVDYLYDKLHYGRTRGKFDAEETIKALRQHMLEDRDMTEEQILADDQFRDAWEEIEELDGCTTGDEFLHAWHDRLSQETRDAITDEPWDFLRDIEPWPSVILREAILPAFIAALNAPAAAEAQP